jgi:tensin
VFGFVARRTGSTSENVCHLFAEMDPEQPAVAIVNFINKVMLGSQQQQHR